MSKVREYRLIKEALLKQKKEGKKLDKGLFEKYKSLRIDFLIETIERTSNKKVSLTEAPGNLAGLPSHWVKYLTQQSWLGMAGENSEKVKASFKFSDKSKMLAALKDDNNVGLIMYQDGVPVFMVCRHPQFENKFKLFTQKPSGLFDKNEGTSFWKGARGRGMKTEDSFTLADISQKFGDDLPNWDVYILTKDKNRKQIQKDRSDTKNTGDKLQAKVGNGYSGNKGVDITPAYEKLKVEAGKKITNFAFDIAKEINNAAVLFNDGKWYEFKNAMEKITERMKKVGANFSDIVWKSGSNSNPTTGSKYDVDQYKALKDLVNNL